MPACQMYAEETLLSRMQYHQLWQLTALPRSVVTNAAPAVDYGLLMIAQLCSMSFDIEGLMSLGRASILIICLPVSL